MAYLSAQFKRQNALEQAQAQYDAQQARAQRSYDTLDRIAPIIPQNPAEQTALERQGFIPYEGAMAENAYISPERQLMQDERIYQDQVAQQRLRGYQDKMQNPLFNIGDTITDVANNTIGLPLKLLSGGQNPFGDPSARAKARYEQDLDDIGQLHAINQKHFLDKRDQREAAFSKSMSGGVGINDITPGHYTPESIGRFQQTGDFNDLAFRKPNTYKVGDVTYVDTPQGMQPIVPMQEALDNQQQFQRSEEFTRSQSAFFKNQSKLQSALTGAENKQKLLKTNIGKAVELVKTAKAAGWNGLLRTLPDSIARDLNATLSTIKANVAFERLQEMRTNSPTGGALGQVSNLEIELLYNSLMPIDQLGSDELLLNSLLGVEKANVDALRVMRDAYNQDVGYYGSRLKETPQNKPELTDKQKNKLTEYDKLFGF